MAVKQIDTNNGSAPGTFGCQAQSRLKRHVSARMVIGYACVTAVYSDISLLIVHRSSVES